MKGFAKDFLIPAVVLTLICLVVVAALAFTYEKTKVLIEEQRKAAEDAGKYALIAGAQGFEAVEGEFPEGTIEVSKETGGLGYVFTTVSKGYGGDYKVMTAIDAEGLVIGVNVLEQTETPGLGDRTTGPSYLDLYKGKDKSLEGVEALTGATISSNALKTAVKTAFDAYTLATGGEIEVELSAQEQIFPGAELEHITIEGALEAYKVIGGGALIVTHGDGYANGLDVMTGFDTEGKIVGVRVVKFGDTVGLGDKAAAPEYLEKYIGVEDVDAVDGITNATYSSDAVKSAIKKARDVFEASKGALIDG